MFNRKEHWQQVYETKSPLDVSWYQKEPVLSLNLIRRTGVLVDDPIIDVGGGASLLIDFLCKDGFSNLSVLDISGNALDEAKKRLGDQAKHVEWIESDITEFSALDKYSVWHDRAVFHFLTDDDDRKKYIETLHQTLPSGGHVIIATFAIGGPDKCSGLETVQYDATKMKTVLGEQFELRDEVTELHVTPVNREQAFMYFWFIKN